MLDKGLSPPVPTKDKVADDLAAWLDDVNLENEEHDHGHCVSPTRVFESNVELYRCSWCSNPSAVLRKCSGCNKTRWERVICRLRYAYLAYHLLSDIAMEIVRNNTGPSIRRAVPRKLSFVAYIEQTLVDACIYLIIHHLSSSSIIHRSALCVVPL